MNVGDRVNFQNKSGYTCEYRVYLVKGEKVSLQEIHRPQNRLVVVKITNIGTAANPGRNGYFVPEDPT